MGNKLHGVEFANISKVYGVDTSNLASIFGLNFCQEQGIHEGFEGTGYELTGWSKDTGMGSTIDEDEATSGVTGAPDGWQDQCLELTIPHGDWGNIYRAVASDYGLMYSRFEFIIKARTNNAGDSFPLACVEDNIGLLGWELEFSDNGSNYDLGLTAFLGIDWTLDYFLSMNEGTPYLVEVYYDWTLHKLEWKVDGVSQGTTTIAGDSKLVKLFVGTDTITHGQFVWGIGDDWTVYIDNYGFSTCGWVN